MTTPRISLFVHLFYLDLWPEMLIRLKEFTKMLPKAKLYFNLVESKSELLLIPIQKNFPTSQILISENRGRDIGGKLNLLNLWLKNKTNDDYLVFCHDKKSPRAFKQWAIDWKRDLLSIISQDGITQSLKLFENLSTGMVSHKNWILEEASNAYELFPFMEKYKKDFSLNHQTKFVCGTMFWVRAKIFAKFFQDHPPLELVKELETGDVIEPSNTHALERIFGLLVLEAGLEIKGIDSVWYQKDPNAPKDWDEANYLKLNQDVYRAVISGIFHSGWEHYSKHGATENRPT